MTRDQDLDLTADEEIVDQAVVRVWRISRIWWIIFLFPLVSFLPYGSQPIVIISSTFIILWFSTYLVRERWRLTLTNRQIVTRQLFPRPLTIFSRIHYFPLSKVEGLSVGPRAFRSILLLGIFLSTNLGVTLLKSGLSKQVGDPTYDLPDSLEATLLVMRGITFLPFLGSFADGIESIYDDVLDFIGQTLVVLGIVLIILGLLTVIFSIPRRYHLQIRVRHGPDFKLSAGIPRSFWENCYKALYKEEIVEAPPEYSKWKFPWLKDETAQTSADLEEIIYLNRLISLFAIYAGTSRIWTRAANGQLGDDVLLWMLVAAVDVFIAVTAVVFSKKKNEMLVTNRRIIFAQEMRDISGSFGRRLYLMSDMGRDDVAGFHIARIRGISYRYLLLTVLSTIITVSFWQGLRIENNLGATIFTRLVFVLVILFFANFILQTYLEFNVKTKGHEIWHLRHQLSNPLTFMRRLIGNDENKILTTLLSNRLEEKEVVDTIQIIRAGDLGMQPKLFGDSKYFGEEFETKSKELRHVELEDLLLLKETVKFASNVSRGVPRRKLNISIATVVLLIMSTVMFVMIAILIEIELLDTWVAVLILIPFLLIVIMVPALWVRYYSLFQARILFSEKRAFFIDSKNPNLFLYLLGIHEEVYIEETLQNQIHSTYTTRQFNQQQYFRDWIHHTGQFFLGAIIFGISIALTASIYTTSAITDQYPIIWSFIPIFLFFYYLGGAMMTWHAANAYIAFIRSIPKRVVHTQGVGSHFIVPFSSKEKAEQITSTVWGGIITE